MFNAQSGPVVSKLVLETDGGPVHVSKNEPQAQLTPQFTAQNVLRAEAAFQAGDLKSASHLLDAFFAGVLANQVSLPDQFLCRAKFLLGQIRSSQSSACKGSDLVTATLSAVEPVLQGITAAAQNPRYGFLVYNGSVHFWHVSRPLQREGLHVHLLPSQQQVVDAVRKLPDKQEWLSRLLLQTSLAQLEAGKADDAIKSVEEAQQLSKASGASAVINQAAVTSAHLQQVSGKATKLAPKAKAPAKPAAVTKGGTKGKGGAAVDPAMLREQQASLLAAIQVVRSAKDPAGQEDRLKEVWEQCEQDAASLGSNPGVVAQLGWAAALQGLPDLAERCASQAAKSQDTGPRAWADLIRAQLQFAKYQAARASGDKANSVTLIGVLDVVEFALSTFCKLLDVDGVHCASRLVWNAALTLLGQPLSPQLKRVLTAAAQALAGVASPLHSLRAVLHLEIAKGDVADDMTAKAALEIKKAQALDYLAGQQDRVKWDLDRPLDRFIEPLNQVLTIKSADEDPETPQEQAILLLERAREANSSAARGQLLTKALQKLAALPAVTPPAASDAAAAGRSAQHAAARLRTRQYCDIATLALKAGLEGLVQQASPLALALEWSADVDPEVVRWQAEVSLIQAKAAALSCLKQSKALLEPPATQLDSSTPPAIARKPQDDVPYLQKVIPQALLTALKLATVAKQPWLVFNTAVMIWNTYLPNMQQQRFAPLLSLLSSATARLLTQPDILPFAAVLNSLVTAYASAAEHAALISVLTAVGQAQPTPADKAETGANEPGAVPSSVSSADLEGARLLAAPHLAPAAPAASPAAATKGAKQAARGDAMAAIPAEALAQLQQAADACEAVMVKLSSLTSAAGIQQLLEAYCRVQQLRGLPATAPANSGPALQQTSKVVAVIESLSAAVTSDTVRAEGEVQQALALLSTQQPLSLELHAKLGKAALQAGAPAAALQCASALLAAGLPKGRAAADIVEVEDAPGVAKRDWQWLAVACLVLGQAIMVSNEAQLPFQPPAVQLQLRKLCLSHLVAAARFAVFAQRVPVLEGAAKACWNVCTPLMDTAEGRSIVTEALEDLAGLMCELKCQDTSFQAELVCLVAQCTADSNNWESGLRHCENAMGVLPSATHLPISKWKVVFLSMLGRSIEDEMARITERGGRHAAAAWTSIAVHTSKPDEQLHTRQQAVKAVSGSPRLQAQYMTALAEWLLQQGSAVEAGKEILLEAASLLQAPAPLSPPISLVSQLTVSDASEAGDRPDSGQAFQDQADSPEAKSGNGDPSLVAADLDLLLCIFVVLSSAASTRTEQEQFASRAYSYAVAMLHASLVLVEDHPTPDSRAQTRNWIGFELTLPVIQKVAASTSPHAANVATIAVGELTFRYVEQLGLTLQGLGWHAQAVTLCHLEGLLAGAVLSSPALLAASHAKLVCLAEALNLQSLADRARQQAGTLELALPTADLLCQQIAMREHLLEAQVDTSSDSASSPSRPRSRKSSSRASSAKQARRGLSSRPSTATSSVRKQDRQQAPATAQLQRHTDAQAWLRHGLYLTQHGHFAPAKDLLSAALSHFQAFGPSTAAAQSLLGLAELQGFINQLGPAQQLVQQALQLPTDLATRLKALTLLAKLHADQAVGISQAVRLLSQSALEMQQIARNKPALASEALQAAASLLLQQGRLLCRPQQQAVGSSATPPEPQSAQAALACFQKAASLVQNYGNSCLHVEALQAQARLLLQDAAQPGAVGVKAAQQALELLQAAETEALQMHEAALALLSLPAPAGAAATAVQAGEPEPAATPAPVLGPKRGQSPQVGAQKQAAAAKAPVPEPESTPQDPQPTLPTAHQLARILAFKAEALLVASGAIQSQPAPEGRFAVPGKDASAVKQYLAGAGLLAPGAVAGYFEAEAIQAAKSALQLSPDPSDNCLAHLVLGQAQLALSSLDTPIGASDAAWTEAAETEPADDAGAHNKDDRQSAVASFQACLSSALAALDLRTAAIAAEQVASCLGHTNPQQAAEALLLAQSCLAVMQMEAVHAVAAAPQAKERLLLRLQDHLQASLPCHTLTHAWQQCRQQIMQDTCLGSRLALQPAAADILAATLPSTYIVSMHVTHDGSMLYCTALRGQQAVAAPARGKAGKPETPEPPPLPVLVRVALPPGALEALQASLKAHTASLEQAMLSAPGASQSAIHQPGQEQLVQEYQGLITSLEGLLGSAAALLSPPALGPPDAKGNLQQSCPLLLLLDYCLADLPWESLPQLQQGTAVARDFSLHLQYIRTSAAASSQGIPLKQLSYIVDPCMEHTSAPPSATPPTPAPKKPSPTKPASKPTTPNSNSAGGDQAAPSLIQAFQQEVLNPYGKGWEGITGTASFSPTEAQYDQLLKATTGLVYCGLGRFLSYVPAAVVAGADMRACQLVLLLDRAQTAQSLKRQAAAATVQAGQDELGSPAAICLLLTLRGVQAVVLSTLPSPVSALPSANSQLLQSLGQAKSVAEATQVVRKGSHGLVMYGTLLQKASSK